MGINALRKINRETLSQNWAGFGLYVFLSAFFWASGPAPLRTVFYVFLLLPFLLVLPWRKFRWEEYGGKITIAALVYAGYTVMASLWGTPSDFGFFLKQWFFLAFWLIGIAWLFYHRTMHVDRLCLAIVGIGVVCALITVYFFYMYKHYSIAARLSGFGLAENATIVAQIFGVAALLAYVLSLQSDSWKKSLGLFLAALVCGLPIVLSQSRGAALSLVVVSFCALMVIRPSFKIWLPQVTVALAGVVVAVAFTSIEIVLQKRGLSLSYRDAIWAELLHYRVPQHPLFGIGMTQDSRIIIPDVDVFHHAHNSWLDILYYAGLFGLSLALWHLTLLSRTFSRHKAVLPLFMLLLYGCLCLFTNGSTLLTRPDAQWWMYWVPAGLLAAVAMSPRQCPTR